MRFGFDSKLHYASRAQVGYSLRSTPRHRQIGVTCQKVPAGPFLTMKLINILLAAGLSLPSTLSANSSKYLTGEEVLRISYDIVELEEIALRCGTRESKKYSWDRYSRDEYSLRARSLSLGSLRFVFIDGYGTHPTNGRVDGYDGMQINYDHFSLSGVGDINLTREKWPPFLFNEKSPDREDGERLQKAINTLRNNLPPECNVYNSHFNCCY